MRKEVIFAILAGALLGLVVAFGVWRANSALRPASNQSQASPTPEPISNLELSIVKPDSLSILTTSKVKLTGITAPNAIVGISAEEKGYQIKADASGNFSADIALVGGLNEIKVVSFDANNEPREKVVLVVYSSEFAKYLTPAPTATGSAETKSASDSVRQKVNAKIELIEKSPIAYIGTITDKTDTTVQIKNLEGEIEQIAIDKDTTDFIKSIDTTKSVEWADMAIGDFIIAMGVKNGNKILDAKRILITTAYKPSARKILLRTVKKNKNIVTIGDITLKFGKNWDGPEVSELTETDKYLIIGESADSTLTVSFVKKI